MIQGHNFTRKSGGDRGSGTRRTRGAQAYNGGLGSKLKGFGKTRSKSVHKFSTFTTYMQGLVTGELLCQQKTSVTRLFGVQEALNPTHWDGSFSRFQ